MKNRLKISLLINTKLSISQHIYVRYVIIHMARNEGQSAKCIAGAKFREIMERQHNTARH